ncbi:MAG: glycosyltransferase [Candidatus Micrarchaeota archaeon]|nr:glycosyltransferase [Candidatus Micrarchaeota archaeon]
MQIHLRDSYYLRLFTAAVFIILSLAGIAFAVYIMLVSSSIYVYFFGIFLLALSVIAGFFNTVSAYFYYKSFFYDDYLGSITRRLKPMRAYPTVAIGVPVKNENPAVVKRTINRLREMNYPKDRFNIYLLDDSTIREISAELKAFCKKSRISYLQRVSKTGFKAGNLNNMLNNSREEFVAVFDYDEYLTNKNFLKDLMPYFQDERIGYIQTEKSSFKGNLLSDSVNLFDAFFFKFIQPARAFNNTAIFSGSCGVIRRRVLDEIGGFPEYVIEDTFFSFMSDMHDYKGLYIPKVYAYGEPVTTFSGLIKQQWRYNYGDTQFLMYFLNSKKGIKKKLSSQGSIEYISHGFGLNYLSVMLILFTITSVMIVFSNLPFFHVGILKFISSANNNLIGLELFGMAAFALSFFTPAILTKVYFNSFKKGFMIFILNFSLAVVRTKAALSALLRIDPATQWARVVKGSSSNVLYALQKTKYEIGLAVVLFAFSALAALSNNIEGGLWLIFYGMLYLCATLMVYRYG